MDGEHLLGIYAGIADLSHQMLAAAFARDWDKLIALEEVLRPQFARLRACEKGFSGDAEYRRSKREFIASVLDNDAQIRSRVEPWQTQLLAMIGHDGKQRRLQETYALPA